MEGRAIIVCDMVMRYSPAFDLADSDLSSDGFAAMLAAAQGINSLRPGLVSLRRPQAPSASHAGPVAARKHAAAENLA